MQRLFHLSWPLLVIFVLCWVAPAQAAAADGEHGPPNVMEFRADTAFWSIVVFLALLFILSKYAWPPILEGLKKREETIRSSIEEAKKTREEMVQLRNQFQKEMAEAQQQIPKLMEDARKKAEEMSNEIRAKAVADIQTERERLRRELEIAKDQALTELWASAAQLATLISAKAIGRSLSEDDHRRLLDESMAEMRRPGNN
jgi:F-type H+-transporting ATPase subunit b